MNRSSTHHGQILLSSCETFKIDVSVDFLFVVRRETYAASGPPTMKLRVPASAPTTPVIFKLVSSLRYPPKEESRTLPPETGASTISAPNSLILAATILAIP